MAKPFKVVVAEILRDSIHNLVIDEEKELDNKVFSDRAKYFIRTMEGTRFEAYLDDIPDPDKKSQFISAAKFYSYSQERQDELRSQCVDPITGKQKKPITTVGTGMVIESEEVQVKFDKLFGTQGFMNQVYWGKANITPQQDDVMLTYDLNERLIELRKIYGLDWPKLRANEKLSILSEHFNGGKALVGEHTNFRRHMGSYVDTSHPVAMQHAIKEIVANNPTKNPGLQNRRDADATMLASTEAPAYTKPNESPDSKKIKIAQINETIIPLNQKGPVTGKNECYFVWRTRLDNKVRSDHLKNEGKVFRRDAPPEGYMPGDHYNCRCWAEKVPDDILIDDEIAKNIAFEVYLRKGTIHPILRIDWT